MGVRQSAIVWLPSSGVVRCDLKSLSSRRLSVQPEGPQALTVTRYLVDGVRPDSTPVEGKESIESRGQRKNKSQMQNSRKHSFF